jgi:hypothetical protein
MDILQNAIESGASLVELDIVEDSAKNMLTLGIRDNGSGMTQQSAEMAVDPFFTTRTTRKVGLGLPLLKQNAERTGGYFRIESSPGAGTTVTAGFVLNSIDRPVLGDVAGVFMLTAAAHTDIRFIYRHSKDHKSYTCDTREVGAVLGDIPLNEPMVYRPLCNLINENLRSIGIETEA